MLLSRDSQHWYYQECFRIACGPSCLQAGIARLADKYALILAFLSRNHSDQSKVKLVAPFAIISMADYIRASKRFTHSAASGLIHHHLYKTARNDTIHSTPIKVQIFSWSWQFRYRATHSQASVAGAIPNNVRLLHHKYVHMISYGKCSQGFVRYRVRKASTLRENLPHKCDRRGSRQPVHPAQGD